MIKRIVNSIPFVVLALTLGMTAPVSSDAIAYQGKIGIIAPITGDMSQNGLTAQVAAELAQQDFQLVHPDTSLELVIEDSESNPNQAAEIIQKFYAQGIRIVVATGSSEEILAIKPFADANGMTVIASTSTAPSLALKDSIIRLTPNDLYHAKAMAAYLRFQGVEEVAPIYRNDVFGVGFFTEFKARFEENGGSVTAGVAYDTAASDFSSYASELAAQVQAARQIHSASAVAVLTVAFGEIYSIFTSASSQPALSTVGWYGTEDYAHDERIDNDAVARSFALSVHFTSSEYSLQALIHPHTSIVPHYENLVTRARKVNSAKLLPSLAVMFDSLWLAGMMIRDSRLANMETFLDNPPNIVGYSFMNNPNIKTLDENGDRSIGYYSYNRYVEVESKPTWALVGSYWPTQVLFRDPIAYREFIPDGKDKQVRIGLMFSLTGEYGVMGKNFARMAEIAGEDINTLLQRKYTPNSRIEYVMANTQSDSEVALTKIKELKQQGVKLVIGPMTSAELEKVADFANQNEMILVSPSSTAVSLAKDDNIFRLSIDDRKQVKALVTLMIQEGYRNVQAIYRNDTYGSDFFSLFSTSFAASGGHCGEGVSYDPKTTQFEDLLKTLENQVTDSLKNYSASETAVLMITLDEGVTLLETLAKSQSSLAGLRWFGGDGIAANKSVLASYLATNAALQIRLTASTVGLGQDIESPFVKTFLKSVSQRVEYAPGAFDVAAYDAVWLLTLFAENQDWQWNAPFATMRSDFIALAKNSFGYRSLNTMNEYGDSVYGSIDFYRINANQGDPAWNAFASYMFWLKERFIYLDENGDSGAKDWSLYQ